MARPIAGGCCYVGAVSEPRDPSCAPPTRVLPPNTRIAGSPRQARRRGVRHRWSARQPTTLQAINGARWIGKPPGYGHQLMTEELYPITSSAYPYRPWWGYPHPQEHSALAYAGLSPRTPKRDRSRARALRVAITPPGTPALRARRAKRAAIQRGASGAAYVGRCPAPFAPGCGPGNPNRGRFACVGSGYAGFQHILVERLLRWARKNAEDRDRLFVQYETALQHGKLDASALATAHAHAYGALISFKDVADTIGDAAVHKEVEDAALAHEVVHQEVIKQLLG